MNGVLAPNGDLLCLELLSLCYFFIGSFDFLVRSATENISWEFNKKIHHPVIR